jgi:hypothetical protein
MERSRCMLWECLLLLKCPDKQRWREELLESKWSYINDRVTLRKVFTVTNVVVVVVVVWGPESGCTTACRLIVHTPCVFNVPTFTARRLHVTTTLEILAAKGENCWARNVR